MLDGWFNDDLPDMNQEEPEVARYEIQNALWWVGVSGIDGIRQDTIQYMPRTFIRDLSNAFAPAVPEAVDGGRSVRARRGADGVLHRRPQGLGRHRYAARFGF